jgi:hypothetical protein
MGGQPLYVLALLNRHPRRHRLITALGKPAVRGIIMILWN